MLGCHIDYREAIETGGRQDLITDVLVGVAAGSGKLYWKQDIRQIVPIDFLAKCITEFEIGRKEERRKEKERGGRKEGREEG